MQDSRQVGRFRWYRLQRGRSQGALVVVEFCVDLVGTNRRVELELEYSLWCALSTKLPASSSLRPGLLLQHHCTTTRLDDYDDDDEIDERKRKRKQKSNTKNYLLIYRH